MVRVAQLVNRLGKKLDAISVTMDSHQRLHIAHAVWYKDKLIIFMFIYSLFYNYYGKIFHVMDVYT
jgi:hypothetical protein